MNEQRVSVPEQTRGGNSWVNILLGIWAGVAGNTCFSIGCRFRTKESVYRPNAAMRSSIRLCSTSQYLSDDRSSLSTSSA